jgi:hypothetical protein
VDGLDDKDYEKSIKIYMKCWIYFRIQLAIRCPCFFKPPGKQDPDHQADDPFSLKSQESEQQPATSSPAVITAANQPFKDKWTGIVSEPEKKDDSPSKYSIHLSNYFKKRVK